VKRDLVWRLDGELLDVHADSVSGAVVGASSTCACKSSVAGVTHAGTFSAIARACIRAFHVKVTFVLPLGSGNTGPRLPSTLRIRLVDDHLVHNGVSNFRSLIVVAVKRERGEGGAGGDGFDTELLGLRGGHATRDRLEVDKNAVAGGQFRSVNVGVKDELVREHGNRCKNGLTSKRTTGGDVGLEDDRHERRVKTITVHVNITLWGGGERPAVWAGAFGAIRRLPVTVAGAHIIGTTCSVSGACVGALGTGNSQGRGDDNSGKEFA